MPYRTWSIEWKFPSYLPSQISWIFSFRFQKHQGFFEFYCQIYFQQINWSCKVQQHTSGVEVPRLLQSKSYLKIIGIPYFPHNSQEHLSSEDVLRISLSKPKYLIMSFLLQSHELSKFLLSQIYLSFGLIFGMFKVEARLKVLSIDALMLEDILLPLKELIWTLAYLNVKIAGNGNTLSYCIRFKKQNTSSTMAYINLKTTTNLVSATKQMTRSIHHASKLKNENHAHIFLSV